MRRLMVGSVALLVGLVSLGCSSDQEGSGGAGSVGERDAGQVCRQDSDCDPGHVCSLGRCKPGCRSDQGCPGEQRCFQGQCVEAEDGGRDSGAGDSGAAAPCPEDMILIEASGRRWCIDRYEASRSDATAESQGTNLGAALSRPGVMPWSGVSWEQAAQACELAGKRLCTVDEWMTSCKGPDQTVYPYGDEYVPDACNGIDAHGEDATGRKIFYPEPTGSFERCTNGFGVYDMSGNLWEYTARAGEPRPRINGGAYNCIDSATLHRCEHLQLHDGGYSDPRSNGGFRCCKDPD